jgi:hypothetical protein
VASISIESYSWAYFTVNTRAVYLRERPHDVPEDCLALAPFLDMFNHSCDAQVEAGLDLVGDGDQYQIVSRPGFSKYNEVFINYGVHDNLKLHFEYGFALSDNADDAVPVKLRDLCSYASAVKMTLDVAAQSGLAGTMSVAASEPSWNLLACVYILSMPPDRVYQWNEIYDIDLEQNIQVTRGLRKTLLRKEEELYASLSALGEMSLRTRSCEAVEVLIKLHSEILRRAIASLKCDSAS